jgi:hypothetical protein
VREPQSPSASTCWVCSEGYGTTPQSSRQLVTKRVDVTEGQQAQKTGNKQQTPNITETKAWNAVATAIRENTQQRAKENQQKAVVESENIHLQRWLVGVGIAQALALIFTIIFIWYQAAETRNAAEASRDSVQAIKDQAGIMERQWEAMRDQIKLADKQFLLLHKSNPPRCWSSGARISFPRTLPAVVLSRFEALFLAQIRRFVRKADNPHPNQAFSSCSHATLRNRWWTTVTTCVDSRFVLLSHLVTSANECQILVTRNETAGGEIAMKTRYFGPVLLIAFLLAGLNTTVQANPIPISGGAYQNLSGGSLGFAGLGLSVYSSSPASPGAGVFQCEPGSFCDVTITDQANSGCSEEPGCSSGSFAGKDANVIMGYLTFSGGGIAPPLGPQGSMSVDFPVTVTGSIQGYFETPTEAFQLLWSFNISGSGDGGGGGPSDGYGGAFLQNGSYEFTGTATPLPEPSSLLLLATGMLGLAGVMRRLCVARP